MYTPVFQVSLLPGLEVKEWSTKQICAGQNQFGDVSDTFSLLIQIEGQRKRSLLVMLFKYIVNLYSKFAKVGVKKPPPAGNMGDSQT